jgi:predicted ATPase with chaperone activity
MDVAACQTAEASIGPVHAPATLEEFDVPRNLLEELALKILFMAGQMSVLDLAERMRVSFPVANELFQRLRKEQLCDANGMVGNVYHIAISSPGRARALELLALNQYTGPAPVSLDSYIRQIRAQSVHKFEVHPDDLARAFAKLVLDDKTLYQLGTAINSGSSIFLYGPTGTGKTTIAETLSRVFAEQLVWIPYAVEVDGQIITLYDPVIHRAVKEVRRDIDDRWVLCQRPAVQVGGELTIEMLDLQFNPVTKFYAGPVQMKANSGVLIVDDFGRQRLRPEELLNRWVVPLDRRIDFLTLSGGKKIEIPFELVVVFATNIHPETLADEAFLRRLQTKIRIDAVSDEQFHEIFRRVCSGLGLQYEGEIVAQLIDVIRTRLKQPLRACYPRDIVNQVCWAAKYEGKPPKFEPDSVMRAVEGYFLPVTTDAGN